MDQRGCNSQFQFSGSGSLNSLQHSSFSSSNNFQQHQLISQNSSVPSVQKPQSPKPQPPITAFNVSRMPKLPQRNLRHQRALSQIPSVQNSSFGSDNNGFGVRGGPVNGHFPATTTGGAIPPATAGFSGNLVVGTGDSPRIRHHQSQFMDDRCLIQLTQPESDVSGRGIVPVTTGFAGNLVVGSGERPRLRHHQCHSMDNINLIQPESGVLGGALPLMTTGFSGNSIVGVGERLRIGHHQRQSMDDISVTQPTFGVSGGAIPPMTSGFARNSVVGANEMPRIRHHQSQSMDDISSIQLESNVSQTREVVYPETKKRENKINVAELAVIDPKRAKRVLTNRQAAAKTKQKELRHIAELEETVKDLKEKSATLSAQIALTQTETSNLGTENKELKQQLQTIEQEVRFQDEIHEALKTQFKQLNLLRQSIIDNGSKTSFRSIIGTNPLVFSSSQPMHTSGANHQLEQLHIHTLQQEQLPPVQKQQLPSLQQEQLLAQLQQQLPQLLNMSDEQLRGFKILQELKQKFAVEGKMNGQMPSSNQFGD